MKKRDWFSEKLYRDIKLSLKVRKVLYRGGTEYQNINILDSERFGKLLALDGIIQTTEKDEFIYHEMMVHPAMFLHRRPRKILVIGGGDGGILREVLKHEVDKAVLVEIDRRVIKLCQKYLPEINRGSFRRRNVQIRVADGAKFVRQNREKFDLAIIDSPDPVGPARALFSRRFYRDLKTNLHPDGIMVRQSGSPFLQREELRRNYRLLKEIFRFTEAYLAAVPTYIGGPFSFLIASEERNLRRLIEQDIKRKFQRRNLKTGYYNPGIHQSAFVLPEYVAGLLR